MVMSLKLSMIITNDDDRDGHDDDVFLAGWGSFEASNLFFMLFSRVGRFFLKSKVPTCLKRSGRRFP